MKDGSEFIGFLKMEAEGTEKAELSAIKAEVNYANDVIIGSIANIQVNNNSSLVSNSTTP